MGYKPYIPEKVKPVIKPSCYTCGYEFEDDGEIGGEYLLTNIQDVQLCKRCSLMFETVLDAIFTFNPNSDRDKLHNLMKHVLRFAKDA